MDDNLKKFKYILIFIFTSLLILSLFFLAYTYFKFDSYANLFHSIANDRKIIKIEALGYIGSYLSGILPIFFSFFTLGALFYNIYLQKFENSQNKEIIEKQSLQIEKQNFENTFFNLLEQHNKLLTELSSTPSPYGLGTAFPPKSKILETHFQVMQKLDFSSARDYLVHSEEETDHYFRLVYQILRFIGKSTPKNLNQKTYSNILRALVDQKTLQLIAINACSTESTPSYDGYKKIIEKFEFLEHLKTDNFKYTAELINNYEESAFGQNIWLSDYVTATNKLAKN